MCALLVIACARSQSEVSPSPTAARTAAPAPSAALRQTPFPVNASFRYLALGASDSVGVGASDPATKSWPALLRSRMPRGTALMNLAVSGSTVAQAIAEQLPDAAVHQADAITVWLAVNDLNQGIDPLAYRGDLSRLVEGLRANRARVFIGTVPDLTKVPVYAQVDPALLNSRVAAYNEAIRAVAGARREQVVVVDLFTGSDVIAREAVVSADGFHPSDRGYELIAERFAAAMRAAGLPLN